MEILIIMKISDLQMNQRVIIQLILGEKKIEFFADVIEHNQEVLYLTPYVHDGKELELDTTHIKGIICNMFADDLINKQRVSWKSIALTTVNRNGRTMYCIKTHGFNNIANHDERRLHDRVPVNMEGLAYFDQAEESTDVVIHDISDVGIAFYVPEDFEPKSQQLTITFSDHIGEQNYDIKISCQIARVGSDESGTIMGCQIMGDNKEYHLYNYLKLLLYKHGDMEKTEDSSQVTEATVNPEVTTEVAADSNKATATTTDTKADSRLEKEAQPELAKAS